MRRYVLHGKRKEARHGDVGQRKTLELDVARSRDLLHKDKLSVTPNSFNAPFIPTGAAFSVPWERGVEGGGMRNLRVAGAATRNV